MPTVFALVAERQHFLDSNGDPLSGGQLFIYGAGSSTKSTTFTESDGVTANANPIVLDSRGEMPNGCYVESGTYKLVLAPANDTDPPGSAIWTRDNLTPINDTSTTVDQFAASGLTPTFVSTTSFTVPGDQRTELHVGRRIKTSNSGGTGYHTITASAFTTLTTVTVANDSLVLDSGLASVSLSILRADDTSAVPAAVIDGEAWTLQGTLTLTKGADVASAAALTLGDGNSFDVTGTTAVTSIATKGVGTHVTLQFDGALTLTHHATDLVLPGGEDITTTAGDIAVFYEYASGDWRLVSYIRADGTGVGGVVQCVEASDATVTGPVASLTVDDTIPQNTEGTEVLSQSFTPLYTDSKLVITVRYSGSCSGAASIISALFDGSANAIAANIDFCGAGEPLSVSFQHVVAAADHTTSAITFSLRVAADTGNMYINGGSTGLRLLGGALEATMVIEEIRP